MEQLFDITSFLHALGEQLTFTGGGPHDLAVCGGSALNLLGFVTRTTKDIDVFAIVRDGRIAACTEMPSDLREAANRVAQDFSLPSDWINLQAAVVKITSLPLGLESRWVRRDYGPNLSVHFIGRLDQIHFKLHAAADRGERTSVHFADLQRLNPSTEEIRMAAHWACETQDPSDGFRTMLRGCLGALGFQDVAEEF